MEEELQSKLTSILNWVEETAKVTEGFVIEQTPLYIQELLAWNFWHSLIWFCIGVLLIVNGIMWIAKLLNNCKEWENNDDFPKFVVSIVLIIFGVIGIPIIAHNFEWLKIAVAPRVFLLEYAAQAVK